MVIKGKNVLQNPAIPMATRLGNIGAQSESIAFSIMVQTHAGY